MRFAELRRLAREAERWLLPGSCLVCEGPVGRHDPLLCTGCQARWRRLPEPQCVRCGQPLPDPDGACRMCQGWPDGFLAARSAVWLDDASRPAIHHLKYGGWWRLADLMAERMSRLPHWPSAATLVPIPLSLRRLRGRGYNQAERLAEALERRVRLPVAVGRLVRCRETGTQTRLTPEARRANVAGAFSVAETTPGTVVLIDDVFTTGATLAEAAATLLQAGAEAVVAVTFARAKPPLG
jgi:ComF family protein